MESFHELLVTLARLICTVVVIVLFFLFIVRPLLDYFIMSREIERRKRDLEEMPEEEGLPLDFRPSRGGGEEGAKAPPSPSPRSGLSEQEKLSRLAASDPEKAGELVKQWVNSDSSR